MPAELFATETKHWETGKHCSEASKQAAVFPALTQSNFQRKEKKYLLSGRQYEAFMARIGGKLAFDCYGHSLISSLYYDTPQASIINRSMEKPLYKEKLRLRMYNVAAEGDAVYVELKKKFKGVVYKRRVPMSMEGAYAFMRGMDYEEAAFAFPLADPELQRQALNGRHLQIAAEIDFSKRRYANLAPAMMIVCNRLALRSIEGSGLRITFDIDPVWRDWDLDFRAGFGGNPVNPDGRIIMEIKCVGAYPLWLVQALGSCEIYPESCSKYGRAYCATYETRGKGILQ